MVKRIDDALLAASAWLVTHLHRDERGQDLLEYALAGRVDRFGHHGRRSRHGYDRRPELDGRRDQGLHRLQDQRWQ